MSTTLSVEAAQTAADQAGQNLREKEEKFTEAYQAREVAWTNFQQASATYNAIYDAWSAAEAIYREKTAYWNAVDMRFDELKDAVKAYGSIVLSLEQILKHPSLTEETKTAIDACIATARTQAKRAEVAITGDCGDAINRADTAASAARLEVRNTEEAMQSAQTEHDRTMVIFEAAEKAYSVAKGVYREAYDAAMSAREALSRAKYLL